QPLRAAVEHLLGAGRRLVVQGPLAEGIESPNLHRVGVLDHRALFPRAALVVHHGGAGTTHAVVAAGVPSVVIPHIGDQRYWADRLRRLGAAPPPVASKGLEGVALAEIVRAAADDRPLREAARQLAARMAGEDGIGAAVGLLETAVP
ncbi:MAG: glycosyltransferase, partial [Candidatus Limnocylindria bacterium]